MWPQLLLPCNGLTTTYLAQPTAHVTYTIICYFVTLLLHVSAYTGHLYRHPLQSTSTGTPYRRPLQAPSTGALYRPPLQAPSTGQLYRHHLQANSTGTIYRPPLQVPSTVHLYRHPLQATSTGILYRRPLQATSTSHPPARKSFKKKSCTQYGLQTQCMLLAHADDLLCLQLHTVRSPYTVHASNPR